MAYPPGLIKDGNGDGGQVMQFALGRIIGEFVNRASGPGHQGGLETLYDGFFVMFIEIGQELQGGSSQGLFFFNLKYFFERIINKDDFQSPVMEDDGGIDTLDDAG
jgi:hypothetical protein